MSSRSSKKTTDRTPAAGDDAVQVGRVRRPHGVRGEAVVEPTTDVAERFAPGSRLWASGGSGTPRRLTVAASRPHKDVLLVRFEEVADREAVEALAGARLEVPESEVPPPPPDTWYEYQLVGCRCRDAEHGDLGEVTAVVEDGGGLLLEVDDGCRRLLVPFVRAFLKRVDPQAREIDLELPPGLVETCASRS